MSSIKFTAGHNKRHVVAVVVFDDVVLADFALLCEVFSRVELQGGYKPYDVKVCGVGGESTNPLCGIRAPFTLRSLLSADTIVVPGAMDHGARRTACFAEEFA